MVHPVLLRAVISLSALTLFSSSTLGAPSSATEGRGGRAVLVKNIDPTRPCRIYGNTRFPIQVVETNQFGQVLAAWMVTDGPTWARVSAECYRRAAALKAASAAVVEHQQEAVNNLVTSSKPVPTSSVEAAAVMPPTSAAAISPQAQPQSIIYPGTKWCGPGDIASNFNDLGSRWSTDSCCRDHDHCPDTMAPRSCKHGLCNDTPYWKSHCDCDDKFRECLMKSTDSAGLSVGFIYFDMAAVSCFRPNSTNCASRRDDSSGTTWCFENPRPFKRPAMARQQLISSRMGSSSHHQFIKHVFNTAGDMKTAVMTSLIGK